MRSPSSFRLSLSSWAVIVLFLGTSSCTSNAERDAKSPTEDLAPLTTISVLNMDGSPRRLLEEARGRVAVVDLWATWCKACERTHVLLEELHATYSSDDLYIAGVSVGEAPDTVRRYLDSHPYSYSVYIDPEFRLADALRIGELPVLYLLDEDGNVLRQGNALDAATLSLLRTTIEKRRAGPAQRATAKVDRSKKSNRSGRVQRAGSVSGGRRAGEAGRYAVRVHKQ